MIELAEVREQQQKRAQFVEWRCERCNKFFIELDPDRPTAARKTCERCKHVNVWVEAYRA